MEDEFSRPRSWDGIILRLRKTSDGAGITERWQQSSGEWIPSGRFDKLLEAPIATKAELAAVGLQDLAGS